MQHCIKTSGLSYKYPGGEIVLDNINLEVPQGSIYGFLGPNGAGKTTTLRLILGLLKKQQGSIHVFNKKFDEHRIGILKHIGSMIETPSIYSHLTASENLEILRKIYHCPKKRISEVLDITGIPDTGNKKAGKFSLGMKQRLSIAIALLHSPSLLILDEPTNGLDPNGIIEIRELLKKINEEQKVTIIISSHLLTEIEKLVTHLSIIHKGKLLFQGTLKELHEKQNEVSSTGFYTSNAEKAAAIITSNNLTASFKNDRVNIPSVEKEIIAKLNKQLVQNGVDVYQINTVQNDLESIFIDLIKN